MKLVDLIRWIQQYDANKGLRRRLYKSISLLGYLPLIDSTEPLVISLIRDLISEAKNTDDLADFQLFQLAKILANTPTEQGTESEKIAGEIANAFGGIDLLKKLEKQKALSFNTVYLLIHDRSPKVLLGEELIKFHSKMKDNPLLDHLMDHLKNKNVPFGIYPYIELFSLICSIPFISSEPNETINYNDKLPDLLTELMAIDIWNLTAIKKIIHHLLQKNPSILNYNNLLSILKFNQPEKLALIINSHLIDQEQFNFLVINHDALNSCRQFNKICQIFTKNDWNINPFFNRIVTEKDYENKIFYAISRLDELKITEDCIIKILDAIMAQPANSTQLIEAIAMLEPEHRSPMEINLCIDNQDSLKSMPAPSTTGFFQPPSSSTESSRAAWLQIQKLASSNSC